MTARVVPLYGRKLRDVQVPEWFYDRLTTGDLSIDRIFGGNDLPGLVRGSVTLLSGVPGSGKTTFAVSLLDQVVSALGVTAMMVSGEEAMEQLRYRSERQQLMMDFTVSEDLELELLCHRLRAFDLVLVDSLQALTEDGEPIEGKSLVRAVRRIKESAKESGTVVILIAHTVKSGRLAGPQAMLHWVDGHAHMGVDEETGERTLSFSKNRFGPSHVANRFCMTATGLTLLPAIDLSKMAAQQQKRSPIEEEKPTTWYDFLFEDDLRRRGLR